jgi:ATP-dependent RNA helicase DDX24/MAK5
LDDNCEETAVKPERRIPWPFSATMDSKKSKRKGFKPHKERTLPKRRKIQNGSGSSLTPRRAVPVDALAWRTVEVPGNLDDAEGFYGLEEVDGVEVIRSGGQVQFVSPTPERPHASPFV